MEGWLVLCGLDNYARIHPSSTKGNRRRDLAQPPPDTEDRYLPRDTTEKNACLSNKITHRPLSIRLYNSIRSLGRGSVPDYLMDMVLDLEDSFRPGRAILPAIQRLQTSLPCHLDFASCVIPKRALFFLSFPIRTSFRASNATLDNRTSEVSHYSASGFRHVKICRNDIIPYDCAIRALAKQF